MKRTLILIILVFLSFQSTYSQLTLSGEFRPRTELRNGYNQIIASAQDPGLATSTRVRLNTGYAEENFKIYLSIQDVQVWGENRQILEIDENNSFSIFEAWASLKIGSKGWSTKLGRQLISYDDQRIFGALNWAQQARNHDLALLQYKKEKFMLDVGLGFNQDFDSFTTNIQGFINNGNAFLGNPGFFTYKTIQYLYLKKNWNKFSGSVLLLNNGFQNFEEGVDATPNTGDGTSNLQTFGTHLEYKAGKFDAAFNGYIQTGERVNELDVDGAYLLGLDLGYQVSDKFKLGAGAEIISGNDGDAGSTGAFFPLFGTNHKFNGFMDLFYVGNHANSVGLVDLHVSANIKTGPNSGLFVKFMNFQGEQDTVTGEFTLGNEIDLVFNQNLKGVNLKIGYSQFFTSDGIFDIPQGAVGDDGASGLQNWAWAMLTIKPKFLNNAKK